MSSASMSGTSSESSGEESGADLESLYERMSQIYDLGSGDEAEAVPASLRTQEGSQPPPELPAPRKRARAAQAEEEEEEEERRERRRLLLSAKAKQKRSRLANLSHMVAPEWSGFVAREIRCADCGERQARGLCPHDLCNQCCLQRQSRGEYRCNAHGQAGLRSLSCSMCSAKGVSHSCPFRRCLACCVRFTVETCAMHRAYELERMSLVVSFDDEFRLSLSPEAMCSADVFYHFGRGELAQVADRSVQLIQSHERVKQALTVAGAFVALAKATRQADPLKVAYEECLTWFKAGTIIGSESIRVRLWNRFRQILFSNQWIDRAVRARDDPSFLQDMEDALNHFFSMDEQSRLLGLKGRLLEACGQTEASLATFDQLLENLATEAEEMESDPFESSLESRIFEAIAGKLRFLSEKDGVVFLESQLEQYPSHAALLFSYLSHPGYRSSPSHLALHTAALERDPCFDLSLVWMSRNIQLCPDRAAAAFVRSLLFCSDGSATAKMSWKGLGKAVMIAGGLDNLSLVSKPAWTVLLEEAGGKASVMTRVRAAMFNE